jgi:hypothetical protein
VLLIVSGLVLIVVGLRVIVPVDEAALEKGAERRRHRVLLVASMTLTGVFTGLLANGGGFLIVPLYLLIFGLRMREAVGTSLLVIVVLAIPTLVTHWLPGTSTGRWPASSPSARYPAARPAASSRTTWKDR